MFESYTDGACPQCALERQPVAMRLNRDDHWECPQCLLQMAGSSAQVMILRTRGVGDFKQPVVSATDHLSGTFMTRQSHDDPWASGGPFRNADDLRAFLAQIT